MRLSSELLQKMLRLSPTCACGPAQAERLSWMHLSLNLVARGNEPPLVIVFTYVCACTGCDQVFEVSEERLHDCRTLADLPREQRMRTVLDLGRALQVTALD